MTTGLWRRLRWAAFAATVLLLASCGDGAATTTVEEPSGAAPVSTAAPVLPTPATETADTTLPSTEECEDPATEISVGSPMSFEIVGRDQPPGERRYFCVQVSDGVSNVTFELTGMTADLNLYVGHPDLETVQQGGIWFWASDERGAGDKSVVAEPGLTDYVNPGPYYIEVSGQDFRASSPFTLNVSTS